MVERRAGGRIDALFNNGAFGQPGAVEDLRREVLEQQFACNVFGWHQLTCAVLPLMRANGSGRIVQCSSVLGLVALKWRGAYNASKFAIEALSDTMRLELKGSNIFVSLIEPGPITSKFVETSLKNFEKNIDEASSHYQEAYAKQRAEFRARVIAHKKNRTVRLGDHVTLIFEDDRKQPAGEGQLEHRRT